MNGPDCVSLVNALDNLSHVGTQLLRRDFEALASLGEQCRSQLDEANARVQALVDAVPGTDAPSWPECVRALEHESALRSFDKSIDAPGLEFALDAASTCRQLIDDGTLRWEELSVAMRSTLPEPSKLAELARAYEQLSRFDRSRPTETELANALEAGRAAFHAIDASDARIGELIGAHQQWLADTGELTSDRLIEKAASLTDFDLVRLEGRALQAYETGTTVSDMSSRWCGEVLATAPESLRYGVLLTEGEGSDLAADFFLEQLSQAGYIVDEDADLADVALRFRVQILETVESSVGSSTGIGVFAQVNVEAIRRYDGHQFYLFSKKANGFANSSSGATQQAVYRGADASFQDFHDNLTANTFKDLTTCLSDSLQGP